MKTKLVIILFIAGVSVSTLLFSCSKSNSTGGGGTPTPTPTPTPTVDCSAVPSKFASDVFPIIQSTCAVGGCHGQGSVNGPGPLTNFAQINANASAIRSAVVSKIMPKTGSLSDADIHKIMCWVDGGALNN